MRKNIQNPVISFNTINKEPLTNEIRPGFTKSWEDFDRIFRDVKNEINEREEKKRQEKLENEYLIDVAAEEFKLSQQSVQTMKDSFTQNTKKPQIKELKLKRIIDNKAGQFQIDETRKTNDEIEEISTQEFELIKKKQIEKKKNDDDLEIESDSDDWSKKSLINKDNTKRNEKREDDDIDITPFPTQSEDGNFGVKSWILNNTQDKTRTSDLELIKGYQNNKMEEVLDGQDTGDYKNEKKSESELKQISTEKSYKSNEGKSLEKKTEFPQIHLNTIDIQKEKHQMQETQVTQNNLLNNTIDSEIPIDNKTITIIPNIEIKSNTNLQQEETRKNQLNEELETTEGEIENTEVQKKEGNSGDMMELEEDSISLINKIEEKNQYSFRLPHELKNLQVSLCLLIYKFMYCGAPYKVYGCYDEKFNVFIVITKLTVENYPSTTSFKTLQKFSEKLPILINKERPKYQIKEHEVPPHVNDIINENIKEVIKEIKHCKDATKLI
ncbi:hypothetical protein, conserved [Entamoeba dispar SAW760]|uniref:Uncharacterized protein n=1 Tax=Entamoeba dispar (strain ATCC PRA-260 / SAW760) TaxID=370354 RepID=B0EK06_ENTDS|nr:uncharacterized protein EDI_049920 [Entamoeba dispar SAW760]EDR25133.1 hypothetical protein, conserved [Entamoeba dispar SAW760]|eukprot:EDR25133.1 hypothetical protein, conserved [Entamoeba dispar SAW760]